MSEDVIEIVEVDTTSMKHTLAKLLLGTLVAFAASKLTESAYDMAVTAYHRSRTIS